MKSEKMISAQENTSTVVSAITAALISAALSLGFIMSVATAFRMNIKPEDVILFSITASAIYALVFHIRKKVLTGIFLILPLFVMAVTLIFNILNIREGLVGFIDRYSYNIFHWELEYPDKDPAGVLAVRNFLEAYSLIAISVTSWSLIRRRLIPVSLILYLPFFVCSVTNARLVPQQGYAALASAGVFMALFVHLFRYKKVSIAQKMVAVLAVPVILFGTSMILLFPEEKYDRNNFAHQILDSAKEAMDEASKDKDSLIGKIMDIVENGWRTASIGDGGGNFASLSSTTTNLQNVGPFNPSNEEVLKVIKRVNSDLTDQQWLDYYDIDDYQEFYSPQDRTLYLKVESLDTYKDNRLTASSDIPQAYPMGLGLEATKPSLNIISITNIRPSSVDIVPYYSDWYYGENFALPAPEYVRANPYNTVSYGQNLFASSPVPVKTGNIYVEDYLERYVYGTALEVPEETERKLILSGDLPKWYLDVYFGKSAMTDVDKVQRVSEFVRTLHPYDKDTDYPPKDADFVPWFVSDAKSGICVHYATTTMVLLRMIGVPSRYVRGFVDGHSYVDKESIVTQAQAHAWFEFFVPEYGWILGDSTPGNNVDAQYFNIEAVAARDPEIRTKTFAHKRSLAVSEQEVYRQSPSQTDPSAPSGQVSVPSAAPSSKPSSAPSPTPVRRDVKVNITSMEKETIVIFRIIVAVFFLLVLLIVITKVSFTIYWMRRFSEKNINDRAKAYYNLYRFTAWFVGAHPMDEVTRIAQKAAFSEEGITEKEYDRLIDLCKRHIFEITGSMNRIKLLVYKLLTVKIK